MSLGAEEPSLAVEASAAQHAEPQPQLHSHTASLMSLASTHYCEPLASDAAFELESNVRLVDTLDAASEPLPQPQPEPKPELEADAQILEALRSPKDRLFVLKLGENMESLIQERHIRSRVELTPASTYHKLLVHRCAAYYKLVPETESGSKTITIVIASDSRIPSRRVADLVPPDDSPLPAFKIMRRTPRSKTPSQTGSGNDDNAPGAGDLSDGDPSEAGSSRGSRRKPLTMSERQAQYEEARSRIFKDLEDKEKEKDMSASSSTLSLPSAGSSSGGGGGDRSSSVGESLDDTGSDRDWVPTDTKDKKNGTRRTVSAASGSSRNLRSTAPPFNGHGHSPGFIYPTLYEPTTNPSASSPSYDSSTASGSSSHVPYQPTLYPVYQYGAPAYLAPYPYAYYPYPHPPPTHHVPPPESSATSNDSPGSSPADVYPPPVFVNHYMWGAPAPPPPPNHQGHPPSAHNQTQPNHSTPGHPDFGHQQYPPPPVHAYTYPAPVPGYMQQHPPPVQPQPQQPQPLPQSQPQPQPQPQSQPPPHPYTHPPNRSQSLGPLRDGHRGNTGMDHTNGSSSQPQLYQPGAYEGPVVGGGSSVPRNGGSVGVPGQKRGPTRSPWSYGPGVGGAGVGLAGEAMGPRITTVRRTSGGNSVSGGFSGGRTHGDETASTASSSTSSSSSKQTFTSTSSKHPLPARPDWAVGLKPQPTLHHSSSHHSSPRSHHGHLPSQAHAHHQRPPIAMPLQSNDFPPLTVSPPNTEKRPTLGGVWAGSSTTRSILGPPLGRMNNGSGVNIMNGHGNRSGLSEGEEQNTRLDEHDNAFERPAPKAGGELFNPNAMAASVGVRTGGGAKSPTRKVQVAQEKEKIEKDKDKANARGEAIANAILIDRVSELRIGDQENHGEQQGGALTNGQSASS